MGIIDRINAEREAEKESNMLGPTALISELHQQCQDIQEKTAVHRGTRDMLNMEIRRLEDMKHSILGLIGNLEEGEHV